MKKLKINNQQSSDKYHSSKKKEKSKILYTSSSILKSLISEKNIKNRPVSDVDYREAIISNYGHYIALTDGFNSTSENRIEVSFPSTADLSLNQKKGFTLFFWVVVKQSSMCVHRYIVKKGNLSEELTPSVGILPKGTNFFVKINTSKGRTESLFSAKNFEYERLYNLSVTFNIDYNNDLTDIAFYIDGLLDSQITVPGEPINNQGHLSLGKPDNLNYGFKGWVGDVILIPRVLKDEEIFTIINDCITNIFECGSLKSFYIIEQVLEYNELIQKYSTISNVPINIVKNININNNELREVFKNYDISVNDKVQETKTFLTEEDIKINNFRKFIGHETSILCISTKNLYTYSQFVLTILTLCDPTDEIQLSRVYIIFKFLNSTLNLHFSNDEFKTLVKLMDAYVKNGELMQISVFFQNLKSRILTIFPDLVVSLYSESIKSDMNSISNLHEKLLISNNKFKDLDNDYQIDLGKASFSYKKNMYLRHNERSLGRSQEINNAIIEVDKDQVNTSGVDAEPLEIKHKNEKEIVNEKLMHKEEEDEVDDNFDKEENDEFKTNSKPASHKDKDISPHLLNDQEIKNESKKDIIDLNNNEDHQNSKKPTEQRDIESNLVNKVEDDQKIKDNTESKKIFPVYSSIEDKPKINDDKFGDFDNSQTQQHYETNKFQNFNSNNQSQQLSIQVDYKTSKIEAKYPDKWNEGKFEIVINRCYDCHNHKTTTNHCEYLYCDKFNEISDQIKILFPNCKILGNFDPIGYYGQFDVYLRGVGPNQDHKNRCFIYILKEFKSFPSNTDILDPLVAISMIYGSSINMELSQSSFLRENKDLYTPSKYVHEGPAELSEDAKKHKEEKEYEIQRKEEKKKVDSDKTKYICCNAACNAVFTKGEMGDNKTGCTYHPGVFQFGSYHVIFLLRLIGQKYGHVVKNHGENQDVLRDLTNLKNLIKKYIYALIMEKSIQIKEDLIMLVEFIILIMKSINVNFILAIYQVASLLVVKEKEEKDVKRDLM